MKLHNKYYILRHGEALSNKKEVVSSLPETFRNPLTSHGKEMIQESADFLKKLLIFQHKTLDFIFASPLLRTVQTAQIVGKALKITPKFDIRLREIDFGILNGKLIVDLDAAFHQESERIKKAMPKGETYQEVLQRMYDFLKDIDKKYEDKNILLVSHEGPLWMLEAKIHGMSLLQGLKRVPRDSRIHKGQIKELN
jgi:broad specificity phosphatase PhoE